MKYLLKITTLIIAFSMCNCNSSKTNLSSDAIVEIGSSKTCGDKGERFGYTSITKDSTIIITGAKRIPKLNDTVKRKTSTREWKKLMRVVTVSDFIKLKPGRIGNLKADGCVRQVYVKTTDSTYFKGGLGIGDVKTAQTLQDLIR